MSHHVTVPRGGDSRSLAPDNGSEVKRAELANLCPTHKSSTRADASQARNANLYKRFQNSSRIDPQRLACVKEGPADRVGGDDHADSRPLFRRAPCAARIRQQVCTQQACEQSKCAVYGNTENLTRSNAADNVALLINDKRPLVDEHLHESQHRALAHRAAARSSQLQATPGRKEHTFSPRVGAASSAPMLPASDCGKPRKRHGTRRATSTLITPRVQQALRAQQHTVANAGRQNGVHCVVPRCRLHVLISQTPLRNREPCCNHSKQL